MLIVCWCHLLARVSSSRHALISFNLLWGSISPLLPPFAKSKSPFFSYYLPTVALVNSGHLFPAFWIRWVPEVLPHTLIVVAVPLCFHDVSVSRHWHSPTAMWDPILEYCASWSAISSYTFYWFLELLFWRYLCMQYGIIFPYDYSVYLIIRVLLRCIY